MPQKITDASSRTHQHPPPHRRSEERSDEESLILLYTYEAVAQALAAIRGSEWVAGIAQGINTVKVSVADVRVEHEVKLVDFTKWLEKPGGSPREMNLLGAAQVDGPAGHGKWRCGEISRAWG
jgi:hypothetical protein